MQLLRGKMINAFTTDCGGFVTQGFLYAPFGEIVAEYQGIAPNSALPKYAFNAKELDEETGMYYYEARYYNPPVFTSRDAMFEKQMRFSDAQILQVTGLSAEELKII